VEKIGLEDRGLDCCAAGRTSARGKAAEGRGGEEGEEGVEG
jgi:hypothetical protein